LLNNDVIFTPDWLPPLLLEIASVVSPICNQQVQYQSNNLTIKQSMSLEEFLGYELDLLAIVKRHQRNKRGFRQVFTTPFFCIKIPHEVYSVVGEFDLCFGQGGGEDYDYCLRCYLSGFCVLQALDSYILHFQGRSTWLGGETLEQTTARNNCYIKAFENKWGNPLTRLALFNDSQVIRQDPELFSLLSQCRLPELVAKMVSTTQHASVQVGLWQPKVGAVYCVYDDEHWLKHSILSVCDSCEVIYFLISYKPWNGEETDNTGTLEIINSLQNHGKKLRVIRGNWLSEEEQRNYGLELLIQDGINYCLVVDADEIYETTELKSMISYVSLRRSIPAWRIKLLTYWKSEQYRIDPPENYRAINLIRLGKERFSNRREMNCYFELLPDNLGACHHMSYARTDFEVLRKISTFSHASEIVPDWYQNVWLGWDNHKDMTNLHPCWPEAYKKAVKVSDKLLPSVLRRK
jgi:hypothetical protein